MKTQVEVKVPFENVNDPTARIVAWNVASGSQIRQGDVVAELENSKTTFPVVAPMAGFVEYSLSVGEEVPAGELLFLVHSGKINHAGPVAQTMASPSAGIPVFSRKARELVAEFNLDPAAFAGLDLVKESDVRHKAIELGKAAAPDASSKPLAGFNHNEFDGERVPLSRAKLWENRELITANQAALTSTVFGFCEGLVPPFTVILFEVVRLLTKFRHLNACYLDEAVLLYRHVHIGFAVDMGHGLKVLVIRNADQMDFSAFVTRFQDLLVKYSNNNLAVTDVTGSTFTVTDLSREGVFAVTPLLNNRQAATLGIGGNVVATNGSAPGFILSCTFDHRLIGGKLVAEFIRELSSALVAQFADATVLRCLRCRRTAKELRAANIMLLASTEPPGHICNGCLFDLSRVDNAVPSENESGIPDWFYERNWRRKKARHVLAGPMKGTYLVLADQIGLGSALCRRLDEISQYCVVVESGLKFAKLSSKRYCFNINSPDHYDQLLTSLSQDNLVIDQILHLLTYGEDQAEIVDVESLKEAQSRGVYSVLFLVQALARVQGGHPTHLQVVSNYSQPVFPADKIACEKSPLMGLLKSISLELPWLRCSHLDLHDGSMAEQVSNILREISLLRREPEVAYRDGHRFVPFISKVNMLRQTLRETPFKTGGVYLVAGGFGEIGSCLAEFLMREYQVKLIIIGRTALPDGVDLPQHGSDFVYHAVGACDLAGLRSIVAAAESEWKQPLSGIFHLATHAGRPGDLEALNHRSVVMEDREHLESMFQAKIYETWTLWQLIRNDLEAIFVAFSSVNSIFGNAFAGAHSAADSFIDVFCSKQRHGTHRRIYSFNWSSWDDLGVSKKKHFSAKPAAKMEGYRSISKEQGLQSLMAGLSRDPMQLIVGLDERKYEAGESGESKHELTAYYTADDPVLPDQLQKLRVKDRFQNLSACRFRWIPEMPLMATGEINRERLRLMHNGPRRAIRDEIGGPRNEVERLLVEIWRELLQVPQVEINNSFFALGGHSLMAAQLVSRVRTAFGIELPLASVFESPTLASMAEVIEWGINQTQTPVIAVNNREKIIL